MSGAVTYSELLEALCAIVNAKDECEEEAKIEPAAAQSTAPLMRYLRSLKRARELVAMAQAQQGIDEAEVLRKAMRECIEAHKAGSTTHGINILRYALGERF